MAKTKITAPKPAPGQHGSVVSSQIGPLTDTPKDFQVSVSTPSLLHQALNEALPPSLKQVVVLTATDVALTDAEIAEAANDAQIAHQEFEDALKKSVELGNLAIDQAKNSSAIKNNEQTTASEIKINEAKAASELKINEEKAASEIKINQEKAASEIKINEAKAADSSKNEAVARRLKVFCYVVGGVNLTALIFGGVIEVVRGGPPSSHSISPHLTTVTLITALGGLARLIWKFVENKTGK